MKIYPLLLLLLLSLFACESSEDGLVSPPADSDQFISAVDISSYPEIELSGPRFYDSDGNENDFLAILYESGVNTIRLRLWVNPSNGHSGLQEVRSFSERAREKGFYIWLTLHYSDTWADPGHQETPAVWQNLSLSELKSRVKEYTQLVTEQIKPEIIQVGNEINSGFLFPAGELATHPDQFLELMSAAIETVRNYSPVSKIMIHYAGIEGSDWFFDQVKSLDYDIIGLSYYPVWHGKDLNKLSAGIALLNQKYSKPVAIAETAYPFTLGWNDWTHNIVGLEEQLILPAYPASLEGQKNFIRQIKAIVKEMGAGFCYWGAELIAWKGSEATDASPWENQALFDFGNKAVPALEEFRTDGE